MAAPSATFVPYDDRDGWIASIRALVDMSPDHAIEWFQALAWNRHGIVVVIRTSIPSRLEFPSILLRITCDFFVTAQEAATLPSGMARIRPPRSPRP